MDRISYFNKLMMEFWEFARQNKAYWIIPVIVILLALGALIFIAGQSMAPFIYTLF